MGSVNYYFLWRKPYYAGSWVVTLLSANLGLGATFTHLLIWNYNDIMGAWNWMSLSSLKRMYENFNWRFWTDDGMRKTDSDDDGELESDPHYREMLKVNSNYTAAYFAITYYGCDFSTLMLQIVGILWLLWFLSSQRSWLYTRLNRLCHGNKKKIYFQIRLRFLKKFVLIIGGDS